MVLGVNKKYSKYNACYSIYSNHLDQINLQLSREPRKLPKMKINPNVKDINEFKYEDFELVDYDPHPMIKGAVAV